MIELTILLYYLFNLVFLWTFGLLLTIKAVKKKFNNVVYFGIAIIVNGSFFAFKLVYILLDIHVGKSSIPEIPFILSFIPGIIFVIKTFYANKNRPIVVLIWIVFGISAFGSITFGFLEETVADGSMFMNARYFLDDIVIYPVLFTWYIVNGIRAYMQNAKTTTRFVRLRFVYFALGHVAGIASGLLDYWSAIAFPQLYAFYAPFSVFCAILYGLFMYLTWFPPTVLNRGAVEPIPRKVILLPETSTSARKPVYAQGTGSTANLSEKMRVIEHFGKILSRFIGKSPSACSGLIFICIEDHLGSDSVYPMGINDLKIVISDVLPMRLEMLGVPTAKEAVAALKDELASNVSLLTMSMF